MPLTHIEAFHRPPDLAAAWRLLEEGGGAVRRLGGGTDLVVACPEEVTTLVDLAGCGLDAIEVAGDGGLRLGAMATFTELLEHPDVRAYATGVLAEMLGQVGSVLHRNSATLGGHLARQRLSDVIPVLLALDATVVHHSGDEREQDLAGYLGAGVGPHIVTAVLLPPPRADAATGAAFVRVTRTRFDHALVNGCARVDVADGRVETARVVVGQTALLGRRVPAAEEVVTGAAIGDDVVNAAAAAAREAVETHDDWVASADYRRHLAGVIVERTLRTAIERATGARDEGAADGGLSE